MSKEVKIVDLKHFLKKQNPEAVLAIKDKENIKDIELSIDSILINGASKQGDYETGSYIELYNDTQETFKEPFTIKELYKELNRFDDMNRVDFISGNEDGEDRQIEFRIEDLIVKSQKEEENKKYIAHLNDIEDEEMTYTRLKEYAHNIFLANIGEIEEETGLNYEDVTPNKITMETIKKLFEFMGESFEEEVKTKKQSKQKQKIIKQ
jgi:hypothetical protein